MRTLIITGYGINADRELAEAFRLADGNPEPIHLADILENPGRLASCGILAFPGGFSFGDHLGSGKVLAYLVKSRLKEELEAFVRDGKLILGICNGFQVLVKMGILPNSNRDFTQEVSLIHNDSGLFTDRWVPVRYNGKNPSPWIKNLTPTRYPIRHGEGRFITASPEVAQKIADNNLAALYYDGINPNGSESDIAGITDETGRILGMMPHPEAYLFPENHPQWTTGGVKDATGRKLFENAVAYSKNAS
ncbi:MAG: phosphoribosylformylglycinamidine synthase subunit PurQ [Spirochaetales bacterium]|jgi:phosphoribosylformylglycinamidine synthase|nr:phosphoribosylformylglycinamidine synthase subunit PurQ [Spirochaetales bacterium]